MKFLIIGLGNFGSTLAGELTDAGHEVVGIDVDEHCIDDVKERISVAYIMDATERQALKSLPLGEMDCVIVAIGHSMDNSLRTVAALKALAVKVVCARALDDTHSSILVAMGIERIFIPESFAARLFATRLSKGDFSSLV